jgi:methyl-accepting chemotaxis protein
MAVIDISMVVDDQGMIQTIRTAGEEFEDLGGAIDFARQAEQDFGDNALEAEQKIRELFEGVDDLTGKIGAAETVAEQFGLTLDQIAPFVDFGAENFGQEIQDIQSRLEDVDGDISEVADTTEEMGDSMQDASESVEALGIGMETVQGASQEIDEALLRNTDSAQAFRRATLEVEESQRGLENSISLSVQETARFQNAARSLSEVLEDQRVNTLEASAGYELLRSELSPTTNRLESQNQEIIQTINSLERMGDAAIAAAIAQDRVRQTSAGFVGRVSNMNNILFETGDLIQDVQFGIRGAGNNIAFLAETIARESSQVGGFRNLLQGVFTALKGPAGIIVGLQTLIALGPTIARWFSDRTEEARGMEKAMRDAAESLLQVNTNIAGFEIQNLEDAQRATRELQIRANAASTQMEFLADQQDRRAEIIERGNAPESIRQEFIETQRQIEAERERLKNFRLALDRLSGIRESLRAQREIEQILEKTSLDRAENEEEANDRLRTRSELLEQQRNEIEETILTFSDAQAESLEILTQTEFEDLLNVGDLIDNVEDAQELIGTDLVNSIGEVDEVIDRLGVLFTRAETQEQRERIDSVRQRFEQLKEEMEGTEPPTFAETLDSVLDVSTAMELGMLNTINRIDAALDALDSEFKNATSQENRDRIRQLMQALEGVKEEMEGAKEESEGLDTQFSELQAKQNIVRAVSGAFVDLAKAIADGERVLVAFGDAARQILGEVMVLIGEQLIALGTARLVAGDPTGAALIALGTGLVTGGQVITPQSEGQREERRQREFEGGGEGTFAPSRQEGGPVQAGRIFEVHGLGDREFFIPTQDGTIITNDQLGAGGASGSQSINVNTTARMSGSIQGPDLFELKVRLDEIETTVEDLARQ